MKLAVVLFGLSFSSLASACPGAKGDMATAKADADTTQVATDASACAKKASLIGGNCSYSTNLMAQKVMERGTAFTYTGTFLTAENKLDSHVAAPFVIHDDIYVIANQVVENVTDTDARLAMTGKMLEVDGTKYFLLTEFSPTAS